MASKIEGTSPAAPDMARIRTGGCRIAEFAARDSPKTRDAAFFRSRLPAETVVAVVEHASEGCSVRSAARLKDIPPNAVNRIILRAGEHVDKLHHSIVRGGRVKEAQLDGLWAFVQKNEAADPDERKAGRGERWIRTAIGVPTRLVLDYRVGGREKMAPKR